MLYLGIDQHRRQLTVNLRNEEGEVALKRQVSTQWDRVRKFFAELEQQAELEGGVGRRSWKADSWPSSNSAASTTGC